MCIIYNEYIICTLGKNPFLSDNSEITKCSCPIRLSYNNKILLSDMVVPELFEL